MGGGLMQLVAYGAQDVYLTGNPQITFFKVVYRRHTNFSMESIEQTFNGNPSAGSKVTCTISRNGDLISRCYLQLDVDNSAGAATVGVRELIDYVEVEIGGQRVDKHNGEWLHLWNELTQEEGKVAAHADMTSAAAGAAAKTLFVPLEFWFCRNPGLALPLIALQYHEVKVNVQFGSAAFSNAKLYVDYIYLDTDERRRFAQISHEYLIEQVQFNGNDAINGGKVRLNFNHPCKELVWVQKDGTGAAVAAAGTAKLQLNGHDRFSERKADYFTKVQPYQHHSRVPTDGKTSVYSFGLKPAEHQPSGTCNMSRIDNATLHLNGSSAANVAVYAVNYNVLRIMSGMGKDNSTALKSILPTMFGIHCWKIQLLAQCIHYTLMDTQRDASISSEKCEIACCWKPLKLNLPICA